MPSLINATTTNGLVTSADNSGSLQLQTNSGTTAVTIDTSQNTLTGGLTSSPGQADPNATAGQIVGLNTKRELRWNNTNASIYGGSGGADDNLYYYSGLSHIFRAAGAERMRIDSLGSLMLNATNGYGVSGGIYAPAIFNYTTASAANMFIESGGFFRRSTSSIKYKTDVQDATHGLADVMKLRPVTYKGINDGEKVFGGLIAEEVHDAGLTEFVQYADDGSPDALAYGQMVSLLTKAIQELKAELDATKAEVQALKGVA